MNKKDLEHIMNIYLYSKKIKDNNYLLISEFVFTYYNSIGSKGYKAHFKGDYNQKKKELLELMKNNNINYMSIKRESLNYYEMIIDDLTKEEDNYSYYYLERSCNNFKSDKKMLSNYLSKLFLKKLHLDRVLKYDSEKEKHKKDYLDYLQGMFIDDDYSRYPDYFILELDKNKLLDEKDVNNIINIIIKRINRYLKYSYTLEIEFIQMLSLIDELNRFLNSFINNMKHLNKQQKDKLSECLNTLLFIKRRIISDESYSMMSMHEVYSDQVIKKDDIKKVVKSISDNPFTIYAHLKHDFFRDMESSLELYSKYPIGSIVSVFNIDSSKQIYIKPNDIEYNNPFKKIFDEYGKEYTIKHPKLINKLGKDYYEEMIKRISQTSKMQVSLLYSFLNSENKYDEIITFLGKETHTFNNNYYVMVAKNIIYIEGLIGEILKKKGCEVSSKGYENIYLLLTLVNGDKDIINGLMFINYSLYEKGGFNLRNNIAHGSLINNRLELELLIAFACNIFVQWLYNKLLGDKDEN